MDEVEIMPPDPAWPARFAAEAARVAAAFAPRRLLVLEHVGSTAVPGLPAKPVVDMLALVPDLADGLAAVPALEAAGYDFWRGNPDRTRLFLVRGLPPAAARRTHHLHITADRDELDRVILFRDLLRAEPEEARAYAALKHALVARCGGDREAYTVAKAPYIAAAIERARARRAA